MEYKANPYKKAKVEQAKTVPSDDDDSDSEILFSAAKSKQKGKLKPKNSSASSKKSSSKFQSEDDNSQVVFDVDAAMADDSIDPSTNRHTEVAQQVNDLLTFDYTIDSTAFTTTVEDGKKSEVDDESMAKAKELRELIDANQRRLAESSKASSSVEPLYVPSSGHTGGAVAYFPKILSAAER